MGSVGEEYSVPGEAQAVFEREILKNPLIPKLPTEIFDAAKSVHFTGNGSPSIPINWRFAESVSALKAFEASMLNVLRKMKYGNEYSEVDINTDHASIFIMTMFAGFLVENDGTKINFDPFHPKVLEEHGYKNQDLHRATADWQRRLATNIYRTKDGRYYHVHGERLASITQRSMLRNKQEA